MHTLTKYRRILIIIIIYITMSLFSNCYSYAGSINIEPMLMELSGKPGEVFKGSYTIINPNETEMAVQIELRKWKKFVQNKDIKIPDWLELESQWFKLKPKESKQFSCTIKIPEGAIGELMAMVYFNAPIAPGSNVRMSIGTSIYVTVKGTEVISAEIEDIDIERFYKPGVGVPPYYSISVKIKNNGNVHLRPRIKVDLKNRKRKRVYPVNFTYGWPVFGEELGGYVGNLNIDKLPEGRYSATAIVTFPDVQHETLKKRIHFNIDGNGNIVKVDK